MQRRHAHPQTTRRWHRSYAIGAAILTVLAIALLAACGDDDTNSDQPAARLAREQTASSCEAPPMPPGTPTPLLQDPLADGTPTPQPPDSKATGQPSKQVVEEVNAAIRNFVNCWNQRKYEQVSTLATPSFLKAVFMQVKPQDSAIVMNGLPDVLYDIKSIGDFQQHPDGRVSVAYDYIFVHQERKGRWYFVKRNGWWMMDREAHIVPEVSGERSVIDVEGNNFAYVIGPNPKAAPVTVFHTHNPSDLPHDFLVVKIKPGVDPLSLLQPDLPHPQGVEFIAQTTLEPGEQEDMVTRDLTPGTYLFICQFRHPGGTPHAQRGMIN
ncbi:MAG: hypothetical protein ACRDJE_17035, partial [Dehalococcoidia bacterium]